MGTMRQYCAGLVLAMFLAVLWPAVVPAQTELPVTPIAPAFCAAQGPGVDLGGRRFSRTITFRGNGSNTSLSCSFLTGSPTCGDTGSTVNVRAGGFLELLDYWRPASAVRWLYIQRLPVIVPAAQ